jgi:hypothetical protein
MVGVRVIVPATGVSALGQVGSVIVRIPKIVEVTGVSADGIAGRVLVWGLIDDNQTPNWQNIEEISGAWTPIAPAPPPDWTPVADTQTPEWVAVNDEQTTEWQQVAA